ncbi:unnamed protein product, partial [Tilletia caries]
MDHLSARMNASALVAGSRPARPSFCMAAAKESDLYLAAMAGAHVGGDKQHCILEPE